MKDMTMEEKRTLLYQKGFAFMTELVRSKVDDTTTFSKAGCQLYDPEDGMIYTLDVIPSSLEAGKNCCIRMGCVIPGTDCLRSYFIFWGSKDAVLQWFSDSANIEAAQQNYHELRMKCLED